jgi:hypothetical protein
VTWQHAWQRQARQCGSRLTEARRTPDALTGIKQAVRRGLRYKGNSRARRCASCSDWRRPVSLRAISSSNYRIQEDGIGIESSSWRLWNPRSRNCSVLATPEAHRIKLKPAFFTGPKKKLLAAQQQFVEEMPPNPKPATSVTTKVRHCVGDPSRFRQSPARLAGCGCQ